MKQFTWKSVTAIMLVLLTALVTFIFIGCPASPSQPVPDKQVAYGDLPPQTVTINGRTVKVEKVYRTTWREIQEGRGEAAKLFGSVTPYAAALLRDIYEDSRLGEEARSLMVSQILRDDVARMKDYKRTTSKLAPGGDGGGGYITKGCECNGTHDCIIFCAGGKAKIYITGVPNCCNCYTSVEGNGGVIDCREGSGCESKNVSCDMSN